MQNLNFHPQRCTRTKDTFINVKSIISSVKVREIIQSQSKHKFNSPQNQMLTKFHSNKLFFEHKSNSNNNNNCGCNCNNHIKPTPTSINITPKHISSVISNSNSNYNLQFSNSSKLNNNNNKVVHDNKHKMHNHFSTQKLAPNKLLNILGDNNKHHKLHKKHHNSNSKNNFLLSPLKKLLKSPDKQTINNSTNITSKKLSKTHPTNMNIEIENNNKYKDEYQYKQTHNNSNSNNNSQCNNINNNNNTRQLSTQNKVIITTSRQKPHSLSQAPLYKSPQTRKTKPNSNLVINTQQPNNTRINAMNTMTTRHNNIISNSKEKKYIYTVNILTNSNRNNNNARSISNKHNNNYKKQSVHNSQKKITHNFIKKYSTELNTKTNSFSEKNININNHNHSYDNSNTKHNIKYPSTNILLSQSKTQTKMQIKVNRRPRNYFHNSSISNTLRSSSNYSSLQRHKKSISLSKHINSKSITVTKDKPRTYLTIKEFIIKYHKYLTLPEVIELKHLPQSTFIYYTNIFEQRKKNKAYSYTNMNNSFTSLTSTQFKLKQYNNIKQQQRRLRNRSEQRHLPMLYHFNKEIDDSDGDYIITQGEHIYYRYEIISLLGKGSYGEAIKCYDHKTKEYVCVKIIKSNIKFYEQAKIEIQILDYISRNDIHSFSNIVKFYTHFTFRNHICLVFELLDINLFEYLQHNDFNGIHINKIRSYTTEILFALLFLHKHRIIHCDLKPENILLLKHKTSNVKVIDFGSSCFDKNKMYSYIQSRFYRAPEVILELGYSLQIDIWSLGCIICELYTGYPIFPGENEKEQLNYIMEYFDVPPKEMIESSPKMNMFFDKTGTPLRTPNSNGKIRMPLTKTLKRFLGTNNEVFIDFICGCLKWFPLERFTPQQALNHRFIIDGMKPEVLNMHRMKIEKILNGSYDIGKEKGKARTGRKSNYASKREMSSRYSARYDPRRNSLSPSERVNGNVKGDKKKKS